jgi:hypothetical protein
MRCLCCHVAARGGVLPHRPTCPEYAAPVRRQPCGHPRAVQPGHDAARRYERFVGLLTERRRDRYDCPSCGARGDGHGLWVTLDGPRIRFTCFSCRGSDEILSAMGLTWEWVTGVDARA